MPILPLIQIESDCGSLGKTIQKGDAPTRCVTEHTHAKESTEVVERGVDCPTLDADESAGELLLACEFAGLRIVDATNRCEVTRADVLLVLLPTMEELVQLEEVTYDDILDDLKCDDIA
ncbi:uncharacterized protein PHALS_01002 [Plasmopara halstedii]|uniref:Uncharacterized protein n=1 Tax=Plasmopara halstedii TaxID=4781 RepID=A0A0P1A7E7_PLAHL|nr:uncharacterized protein PHALS_01002 [Plasmopara halstedii]CEG36242.1 hypothetical protein PHALS_01002 [Plasmopara halstedii]|eukprot:XP_024572611.1 hypothetical protein PHALS_01002 [Plasmopara halstedii]